MISPTPKPTVLIVDDEADIRLLLKDVLAVRYHILTACDGLEALEYLGETDGAVDLVITDLRMPRLDGIGLVEAIQQHYPRTGVLVISAHGTADEAVQALKSGAYDYITKPLPADLREIYAKCERFFRTQAL
jgi:DNA-binding NtrC family response regulator